ncbi:MAG: hypothetical protein KKD73_04670 [Proteobacteria bacterium]|nr:hypothetical protein [Pseudomonadota bacterium]MBU1641444.1 hypothetical protein [Pseudomonadota bacterium]
MKHFLRSLCCFALFMVLFGTGCSKEPVRHLSSDSCLIAQGTTKQDVLTYMGTPKFKKVTEGGEIWTFVQEHLSLLKKTPVLNLMFGSASYELVYITFVGDIVTNCQYRAANEEEYKQSTLPQTPAGK